MTTQAEIDRQALGEIAQSAIDIAETAISESGVADPGGRLLASLSAAVHASLSQAYFDDRFRWDNPNASVSGANSGSTSYPKFPA